MPKPNPESGRIFAALLNDAPGAVLGAHRRHHEPPPRKVVWTWPPVDPPAELPEEMAARNWAACATEAPGAIIGSRVT